MSFSNNNTSFLVDEMEEEEKKYIDSLKTDPIYAAYAKDIDDLFDNLNDLCSIQFNLKIHNIIKNCYLIYEYNLYLNTLAPVALMHALNRYELINSDNFYDLIKTISFNKSECSEFQRKLKELIFDTKNPFIANTIYNSIIQFVNSKVDIKNVNNLYLTSKNVLISNSIEDLKINSYKSIIKHFNNFTYFEKTSASDSLIFSAELEADTKNELKKRDLLKNKQQFYFKVFPVGELSDEDGDLTEYNTQGLDRELYIYKELYKLIKYNVTPNILSKVSTEYLHNFDSEFFSSTDPKITQEFKDNILKKTILPMNRDMNLDDSNIWDETGVIITHRGGETLNKIFKSLSVEDRKKVMFQIIYTLYVFEKLQISHGDLHAGNIFVTDVLPTVLTYIVEGEQYSFTTTKLVKIYDFDHGMIHDKTTIKKNKSQTFYLNEVFNTDRDIGSKFSTEFAETHIFNKNLDICILFLYSLPNFASNFLRLEFKMDPIFTRFIHDVMPGFLDTKTTIRDTYNSIIPKNSEYLEELNRLMDLSIDLPYNLSNYKIDKDVLDSTWNDYYLDISEKYGRIVKKFDPVHLNHLWIPPTIIIDKVDMLHNSYFDSLKNSVVLNITKQLIYTLDNRLSTP